LKPGGIIVITTPNYAFLWPVIESFLNRFGKVSYEEQHIARYRVAMLDALLREAGFARIEVETCLWCAPFAASLGWKFADLIERLEPDLITRNLGHLLVGTGRKP
jgi:hypothetical protein